MIKDFKTACLLAALIPFQYTAANTEHPGPQVSFTENKGQVHDQYSLPRTDVIFSGVASGMTFHLRKNGISYQISRVDTWKTTGREQPIGRLVTELFEKIPDRVSIYRIDMEWTGCNPNTDVSPESPLQGYSNYYNESCPEGALNVRSYGGVRYRSLYDGIDLRFYGIKNSLEYDYIVGPGADYKNIRILVRGAKSVHLAKNGDVKIRTPFGTITESKPLAFQGGRRIDARWSVEGNELSFVLGRDYDPSMEIVIDPVVRIWGTYYGGTGREYGLSCITDKGGNVYFSGSSDSNSGQTIATSGAFQVIHAGDWDAYLAKFNTNGTRMWATYYGGSEDERGYGCAIDPNGSLYMCGNTESPNVMATSGAIQTSLSLYNPGYGNDAFLAKFDVNGFRVWGTYYGSNPQEVGFSCACDAAGNVYMAGYCHQAISPGTAIATQGSHQSSFGGGPTDAFLVKFSSNGVRQWGTYYGGTQHDASYNCAVDPSGNICLSGASDSYNGTAIATAGSHKPTLVVSANASNREGFLAKFSSNGVRLWGTYYGGTPQDDEAHACATDAQGNIFIAGFTRAASGTGIETPGAHQTASGGNTNGDAFLAKFSPSGVLQWGTFYGGTGVDWALSCSTDKFGSVYVAGCTTSSAGTIIATTGAHQAIFGGGNNPGDAYLAKFNSTGIRQWGTYYGGAGNETAGFWGIDCAVDTLGNVFAVSHTQSNTGTVIATPASHQASYGGGMWDAFLVKFNDGCITPSAPVNQTIPANQLICNGNTTTLNVAATGTINWYSTSTGTMPIGSGSNFVTPVLSPGIHTFYAEALVCAPSASRTAITVTVDSQAPIVVNSGSICAGQTFTILPAGANTYTISGGTSVVSPSVTTSYTITGTSVYGCVSQTPGVATVSVLLPALSIQGANSVCSGESALLTSGSASQFTWSTGQITPVISVTPTQNAIYSLTGTDANGCKGSASHTVIVKSLPELSILNASICPSQQATLSANTGTLPVTYTWQTGVSNAPLTVSPSATSVYSLEASLDGCKSSASATVFVLSSITPVTTFSYAAYCAEMLHALPSLTPGFSPGGTFSITEGLTIDPVSGLVGLSDAIPGTYSVTYTLPASGCSLAANGAAALNVLLTSTLDLLPEVTVLAGGSVTLSAAGAVSYSWSPAQWLSCDRCAAPVASPPQTTQYCVISPGQTCVQETCVNVIVDEEGICSPRRLNVPNAFSPNNDGNNDFFHLEGWSQCVESFSFMLFDRWGEKVFETSDAAFKWDGRYKGKVLPAEVLVYMLRVTLMGGSLEKRTGNVTLVR